MDVNVIFRHNIFNPAIKCLWQIKGKKSDVIEKAMAHLCRFNLSSDKKDHSDKKSPHLRLRIQQSLITLKKV